MENNHSVEQKKTDAVHKQRLMKTVPAHISHSPGQVSLQLNFDSEKKHILFCQLKMYKKVEGALQFVFLTHLKCLFSPGILTKSSSIIAVT